MAITITHDHVPPIETPRPAVTVQPPHVWWKALAPIVLALVLALIPPPSGKTGGVAGAAAGAAGALGVQAPRRATPSADATLAHISLRDSKRTAGVAVSCSSWLMRDPPK